ncbi:MAG: bifunctional DNA-formamidopyrimidine glycosylase/DNA-(apurinic or apyrimidinic site) lyase [Patescibacteria group bacterium]
MPELPEVETIRLGLQRYIVGKTIEDVEVRLPKIISGDTKNIIGGKVVDVKRFGKGLVIDLDNGYSLAIHIKLTGQLIYRGSEVSKVSNVSKGKIGGELPNKFTHVIFKLKSPHFAPLSGASRGKQNSKDGNGKNAYLYYNDLRQFGWIKIVKTDEVKNLPFFKDLGPEFLNNLTMKQFNNIVSSSSSSIKPLLMDQKKMSGVGNIYANDALFEAKIDPRRSAKQITPEEAKRLFDSILKVLKKGLESGGASELSFVNVLGQEGGYQNHFLVYGRESEKCKRCGSEIKKIRLGGRGTYFCEKCQK